ncbi:MAG: NUDIX domain-containing protein [Candidatus Pacearchaeota archaeon]|jgi:ADP-ribose pyrophosphatase YjhB (NUDIX family)
MINEEYKRKILALVEGGLTSFSEIKKKLRIESNQLAYHIKNLVKNKFLSKSTKGYSLTQKSKTLMPYLRYASEFDLLPMVSVAVFVKKGDKVLLLKRKWEPFKEYYIGLSGKLKRFEDIYEAAKKRAKELTGIDIQNPKLFCINNFISQTNHFLMFFFRATTKDTPEDGEWVSPNELKKINIFPETKYILEKVIKSKTPKYITSFFDDRTKKFKVFSSTSLSIS